MTDDERETGTLVGELMSPDEFMAALKRSQVGYDTSGGDLEAALVAFHETTPDSAAKPVRLPTGDVSFVIQAVVEDGKNPIVEVTCPDDGPVVRMTSAQADRLATEISRAARAADVDAFLLGWMLEAPFFESSDAKILLASFREWRSDRRRISGNPPRKRSRK